MKKNVLILFLLFVFIKVAFGAQIVCIDNGTLKPGINELSDIVSIHEDNVELTGAGYNSLKIIRVQGLDKAGIETVLGNKKVEIIIDPNDPYTEYWLDSNTSTWYEIKNRPKYNFTVEDLTEQDISDLQAGALTPLQVINTIGKAKNKIPLDPNNRTSIRARRRLRPGRDEGQ